MAKGDELRNEARLHNDDNRLSLPLYSSVEKALPQHADCESRLFPP